MSRAVSMGLECTCRTPLGLPVEPDADSDTPAEILAIQIAGYRAMSPAEKLQRVLDLNRATETLASAGLRRRRGPLDERSLRRHLATLRYPPELVRAACAGDRGVDDVQSERPRSIGV